MSLRTLLAAALIVGSATSAMAFDTPPPVDAPEYTGAIAGADGWYIRGDLGYNVSRDMDKPTVRDFDSANQSYSSTKFDSARLDGNYSLNAGMGYQFSDFLRSDLTLDYFKGDFSGKSTSNKRCGQQPIFTKCGSSYESTVSGLGLMANGYVDLGTYWGLTPYLGAGAGMTNVDWSDFQQSRYCVGTNCDKSQKYKGNTYSGAEGWRFTYALMTGVSYDISPSMKLDLGYRFSQIRGGDMFDWGASDSNKGASGEKAKDKGLTRQEFRVGLRMTTW